MAEVREVAEWLSVRADWIQEPLRTIASVRLTDPVFGAGPVSAADYVLIHGLEGYWPEGTVERLEDGPDVGESLVGLLDVLGDSWGPTFDNHGPRILAALPARCDGATDEALIASCERVTVVYESGPRFDRGSSTGCGAGFRLNSRSCDAIRSDWNELQAETGELEVVWLIGGG